MANTTCGWCGVRSHMTPFDEGKKVAQPYGGAAHYMATFSCDECGYLSLAVGHSTLDVPFGAHPVTMTEIIGSNLRWFPAKGQPKPYDDVPEHVAAAASEAHECHSIGAYRAAVQLARSVVEATAKEKGITSGRLVAKIDAMEQQGLLRPHIAEAAHEIRHLGNEMAHGDFVQPVTEEESAETLELMSEILHEVFQSPARVERRKQARLARE